MNNIYHKPRGIELSLVDLLWRLLYQWKAILIVCIITAVLLPAVKYSRDYKAYNATIAAQKEASLSDQQIQEEINGILASLPTGDRIAIENVLRQEEWLERQSQYMKESILMNLDSYNVKRLSIGFQINGISDDSTLDGLYAGYSSAFDIDTNIERLANAISPEANTVYIKELISFNDAITYAPEVESVDRLIDAGSFCINIVLPEGSDSNAIEAIVKDIINNRNRDLVKKVGEHNISVIYSQADNIIDHDIIKAKYDSVIRINTTQSNLKNSISGLSDAQNAAYQKITSLLSQSEIAAEESTISSASLPSFSKRVAVLGFVLGFIAYAFFYALILVLNNRVNSISFIQYFVDDVLIGDVFDDLRDSTLISFIFDSKLVRDLRFKDKAVSKGGLNRITESIIAISKEKDINKLSLVCLGSVSDSVSKAIENDCLSKEISCDSHNMSNSCFPKDLSGLKDVAVIVSSTCKIADLEDLLKYIYIYSINSIGIVFVW